MLVEELKELTYTIPIDSSVQEFYVNVFADQESTETKVAYFPTKIIVDSAGGKMS
jgi:hypothetical protein